MQSKVKLRLGILGLVLLLMAIGGYLWQAGLLSSRPPKLLGGSEKIKVGTAFNSLSGLLYVAQALGFAKEFGLDLQISACSSGENAVRDLLSGRIEVACCAEFVLVNEILAGARDLRCFGVFCSGSVHVLIARRDRGISRPEDLRGKTIGVPLVHSARFFLARFLALHQISLKEVTLVDVRPSALADALAAGKVDAVMAWEPRSFDIVQKIGPNAVVWPGQEGQDLFWLLVSREEVIQKKSAALGELLQALARAADFARENPWEVRKIVARQIKVPPADLKDGKLPLTYDLFLDQALLLAMEDQARWMIQNNLTEQKQVPYFFDYLNVKLLLKANPRGVRLVLPSKGRPG